MRFYGAGTHKVQPEKKWLLVDSSTLICMLESSVSISPTRLGQCKKCLNIQPNTFKIPRRFLDLQNPGFRLGIAKFAWNPFYLRRCPRSPGAEGGNRLEKWGVGGTPPVRACVRAVRACTCVLLWSRPFTAADCDNHEVAEVTP